jgi:hypothetical protein
MPTKPPSRIVIAKPPAKRHRTVQAVITSPVRIVAYSPTRKQRDAWRRFKELTGRDD